MKSIVCSLLRVSLVAACAFVFLKSAVISQESALNEKLVPTFITNTDNPALRDYWPAFSPDGKSVLFSRTPKPGAKWELFIVPVTGGEAHQLFDSPIPVSATRASWSPSGQIAFTGGTIDEKQQLWLIDSVGAEPKHVQIQGLSNYVFYPSWYSDGQQLVVIDGGNRVLQKVDLKHNRAVALTDPAKFMVGMPSVSPNGEYVAFAGQENRGGNYDQTKNSICIIEDGTSRTVETDPKQGRTPNWSPDGRWIAFESNRGSPDGRSYAIFIMEKDGSNLKRLTPYSWFANHPVWSPDGTKMVFSAIHPERRQVSGIAIINVNIDERSGR